MPILDFKELSSSDGGAPPGETFEGLVRELGAALGLRPEWSGRGADQGRDLIFTERRRGHLGSHSIRWLVSCKDFANSGSSVKEGDVGSVSDKVRQHKANGFLLATTTTASTGLKAMLDGLKSGGGPETMVWDRHELEAMLLRDAHLDLVKRHLTKSYTAYKRLSSLPQALDSIEALVPKPIYDRILAVIQTYQAGDSWLTGDLIWPHDQASSQTIDRAIAALLGRSAPDEAASELLDGDIEFDAFETTLRALASVKPIATQVLCQHLVWARRNDGPSLFAYRFFVERFEPSSEEQIALAAHLAPEDLHELYDEEVSSWINEELVSNPAKFQAWNDLDALSSQTTLDDAYIDSLDFKVGPQKDRIEFDSVLVISVSLSFDREDAGSSSFPGRGTGYIDANGMFLEEVTVNTSSHYK